MNKITMLRQNSLLSSFVPVAGNRASYIITPQIQNIPGKTIEPYHQAPLNKSDEDSDQDKQNNNIRRKFSLGIPETWKTTNKGAKKGILIKRRESCESLWISSEKKSSKSQTDSQNDSQINGSEERNDSNTCTQKRVKRVSFASEGEETLKLSLSSNIPQKYQAIKLKRDISFPNAQTQENNELKDENNTVSVPCNVFFAIKAECETDLLLLESESSPKRRNYSKLASDHHNSRNNDQAKILKPVDRTYGFKLPMISTPKASNFFKGQEENIMFMNLNKKPSMFLSLKDVHRYSEDHSKINFFEKF